MYIDIVDGLLEWYWSHLNFLQWAMMFRQERERNKGRVTKRVTTNYTEPTRYSSQSTTLVECQAPVKKIEGAAKTCTGPGRDSKTSKRN